jgi:hypothetical protein
MIDFDRNVTMLDDEITDQDDYTPAPQAFPPETRWLPLTKT